MLQLPAPQKQEECSSNARSFRIDQGRGAISRFGQAFLSYHCTIMMDVKELEVDTTILLYIIRNFSCYSSL
jgi:hypothetical protein